MTSLKVIFLLLEVNLLRVFSYEVTKRSVTPSFYHFQSIWDDFEGRPHSHILFRKYKGLIKRLPVHDRQMNGNGSSIATIVLSMSHFEQFDRRFFQFHSYHWSRFPTNDWLIRCWFYPLPTHPQSFCIVAVKTVSKNSWGIPGPVPFVHIAFNGMQTVGIDVNFLASIGITSFQFLKGNHSNPICSSSISFKRANGF